MTFYTSVTKGLKLKVRKFWGLIPTFAEVTEENLVRGAFLAPPILNRVKTFVLNIKFLINKNREDKFMKKLKD